MATNTTAVSLRLSDSQQFNNKLIQHFSQQQVRKTDLSNFAPIQL